MAIVRRNAETAELGARGALAGPPFDPAGRHEIERRDALGDARRVIVVRRHQHDAVAEPDVLGALRAGGEKDFRGRGVGIFLEKMMLDLPGEIDAEPIGELHLIERLLEELELGAFGPRPRQLMLVENPETHRLAPR